MAGMKADVRIFKDIGGLSKAAAQIFIQAAGRAIAARGRFLVALSGGSTPIGLYRLLAEEKGRVAIDWAKVYVFWGDERCVPPDDEGSNYHQASEILLQHVSIPETNLQRIKGELGPAEASDDYAQTLKTFAAPGLVWPRFDLVLLGMGADGHTASLFPGSPVETSSPALPVTAHYQGRPATRVTLTPPVLNSARTVLFLVSGADKAETLHHVLADKYMLEKYPAQRIQPVDGELIWLLDESAAKGIS